MAQARPRGRDEVIEALLQSARKIIAERGPSVALRDIADDAGVSFGLVHHYLGTKDQLVDEVYNKAARLAAERLANVDHLGDAIRLLMTLGDGTTARLIGWSVLEGHGSATGFRDAATLELLADLTMRDAAQAGAHIAEEDARVFAALSMVIALGWRLFGPTALFAAGLDGARPEDYRQHLLGYLEQLAGCVTGAAPSPQLNGS
jgi:AcrR family transcriptional regulator